MLPSTSSGALVGAGGKVCTPSSAGAWNGSTASYVFSDSDIYGSHTGISIRTNESFEGDIDVYWEWTGGGDETVIGFMPVSSDGSFTAGSSYAGMAGSSWFLHNNGSNTNFLGPTGGSSPEGNVVYDPVGKSMRMSRESGTVALYADDVLIYTWDDDSSSEIRIVIANGNSGAATDFDQFTWCV